MKRNTTIDKAPMEYKVMRNSLIFPLNMSVILPIIKGLKLEATAPVKPIHPAVFCEMLILRRTTSITDTHPTTTPLGIEYANANIQKFKFLIMIFIPSL